MKWLKEFWVAYSKEVENFTLGQKIFGQHYAGIILVIIFIVIVLIFT